MSAVLADADLDRRFQRDGFVRLNFDLPGGLENLRTLHEVADPRLEVPFYTSMWSPDVGYRERVSSTLCSVLHPWVSPLVPGFEPFVGGFLVKRPEDPGGTVAVHQDWSYVDESASRTVILWVPLVDTHAGNGRLAVVPGSHRFVQCFRPNGDARAVSPYSEHERLLLDELLVHLDVRAGEAILYDPRLIHYSAANASAEPRAAAGMAMATAPLDLRHYVVHDRVLVDEYRVPPDFYWRSVKPGAAPVGEAISLVRTFPAPAERIAAHTLRTWCAEARRAWEADA